MSGNGEIRSYRDLLVWQTGMALAKQIYGMTRAFPDDERFGLTDDQPLTARAGN
jgi:hypothetical protein